MFSHHTQWEEVSYLNISVVRDLSLEDLRRLQLQVYYRTGVPEIQCDVRQLPALPAILQLFIVRCLFCILSAMAVLFHLKLALYAGPQCTLSLKQAILPSDSVRPASLKALLLLIEQTSRSLLRGSIHQSDSKMSMALSFCQCIQWCSE